MIHNSILLAKTLTQKLSTVESLSKHFRELFVLYNSSLPHSIQNYNYHVAWL